MCRVKEKRQGYDSSPNFDGIGLTVQPSQATVTYASMRHSRRRVAVLCSRDARVAMRLSPLYATPCDVHILIRQSHRHEEG